MKKEILNISKHIFNNNNKQSLIELDKLIALKHILIVVQIVLVMVSKVL